MDSNFIQSAIIFTGTILQRISTNPDLVSSLNFNKPEDRETFASTVIWDQEQIASLILPTLKAWSDVYPTIHSTDDFSNRDVIGSYPADDPRSGWWLICCGSTFLHLAIGYPDVLVRQSIESSDLDAPEPHEVNPEDGLICDFTIEELNRLMEIFAIVSSMPEGITETDIVDIDTLVRMFDATKHNTILDLLDEHIVKTNYVPTRSYLDVAAYQPGIYIYSMDPALEHTIANTVVSIRRFDDSHSMYYFKNNTLHREPPFTLNDKLHASIMNG